MPDRADEDGVRLTVRWTRRKGAKDDKKKKRLGEQKR